MTPSPRWIIIIVLAALGLVALAAASDGPRTAMTRASDRFMAIVALASGDTGNATVKCCKTTSPRVQTSAPGVLTAAAGAEDPRVGARFARPADSLRRTDRTVLPELEPPQFRSPA